MADDIFLPATTIVPKLRWFEVTLQNPYGALPELFALAEILPTDGQGAATGPSVRSSQYDLRIAFNPLDQRHLQVAALLDELVKEAHNSPEVESP